MARVDREKLKHKIIGLIDESRDPWRKAAFYGDETVSKIVDELYARWEKSGRKGIPLDYASDEELKLLAELAEVYSRIPVARVQRMIFFGEKIEQRKESVFRRIIRRLFGR